MITETRFTRLWKLQMASRRTTIMKKVRCAQCEKAFDVLGERETTNEISQAVTCPYCKALNDMVWPIDLPFVVREISSHI